MIPFDFEYYRPTSLNQAIETFLNLESAGKDPMYYGGGTEFISMGRMSNLATGAVIDIKEIPEHKLQEIQGEQLIIGSGVTLTEIHEANLFPLLSQASARVADHTIQNKITLGGNLCGTIIYRESVLPLLLADSEVVVSGPQGRKTLPVTTVFNGRMQLGKGEFVTQVKVKKQFLSAPYIHVKRTKQDRINYPLLTICAVKVNSEIRTAFSGLCGFPFRSLEMEEKLNNRSQPAQERVDNAIAVSPGPILNNLDGSCGYRRFILRHLLISILDSLEG